MTKTEPVGASGTLAPHDELDTVGDTFAIVPLWLIEQASSDALRLFALLAAKYASRGRGTCFPSQTTLAADLGATDRAVRNWLTELRELGAVRWTPGRPGVANRYTLWTRTTPPPRVTGDASSMVPARNVGSGTPERGFRAARNPRSGEPEESRTRSKAARGEWSPAPADAKAPAPTTLGRGLDAPPLWELDEDGTARRTADGTALGVPATSSAPVPPRVPLVGPTAEGRRRMDEARAALEAARKPRP